MKQISKNHLIVLVCPDINTLNFFNFLISNINYLLNKNLEVPITLSVIEQHLKISQLSKSHMTLLENASLVVLGTGIETFLCPGLINTEGCDTDRDAFDAEILDICLSKKKPIITLGRSNFLFNSQIKDLNPRIDFINPSRVSIKDILYKGYLEKYFSEIESIKYYISSLKLIELNNYIIKEGYAFKALASFECKDLYEDRLFEIPIVLENNSVVKNLQIHINSDHVYEFDVLPLIIISFCMQYVLPLPTSFVKDYYWTFIALDKSKKSSPQPGRRFAATISNGTAEVRERQRVNEPSNLQTINITDLTDERLEEILSDAAEAQTRISVTTTDAEIQTRPSIATAENLNWRVIRTDPSNE